jgi:hypothetical protein
VGQMNVYLTCLQIEIDSIHLPRFPNPQNLRVEVFVWGGPLG